MSKRIFSLIMSLVLILGMSATASAEETSFSTEVPCQFVVSIPTSFSIDTSDDRRAYGKVSARGSIQAAKEVSIIPKGLVKMRYTGTNSLGILKNTVALPVMQDKLYWTCDELTAAGADTFGDYGTTRIDGYKLSSGSYIGSLQYTIEMNDIHVVPAVQNQTYTETIGGINWKGVGLADGTLVINATNYDFTGNVITPSLVAGHLVTKLNNMTFNTYVPSWNSAKSMTSIVISEGVTQIGDAAFDGCLALESIQLPSTLKIIGASTFVDRSKITELIIPEGVTTIGSSAFAGMTGLTDLVIPDSVTSIGANAFSNVAHVTYHGSAADTGGNNWGAVSLN